MKWNLGNNGQNKKWWFALLLRSRLCLPGPWFCLQNKMKSLFDLNLSLAFNQPNHHLFPNSFHTALPFSLAVICWLNIELMERNQNSIVSFKQLVVSCISRHITTQSSAWNLFVCLNNYFRFSIFCSCFFPSFHQADCLAVRF